MICKFCAQEGRTREARTSRAGLPLCVFCAVDWDEWHEEDTEFEAKLAEGRLDEWNGTI